MSVASAGIPAPHGFEPAAPRLRAVLPVPRRRPRVAYALVAVAGALAIAGAQMALSILTTQTSYELSRVAAEQRDLTYQTQILNDDLAGLSSPQFLGANASALGMVISESPSYLRLSDGAVLGAPAPAEGASSIDALNRAAVPNALIAETPLVTAPDATIQRPPAAPAAPMGDTPAPLTEGLPTPTTH